MSPIWAYDSIKISIVYIVEKSAWGSSVFQKFCLLREHAADVIILKMLPLAEKKTKIPPICNAMLHL